MHVAFALLLALFPQDPELDAALAKERERIAAKKPLTGTERTAYVTPRGEPAKVLAGYRLAVIPLALGDGAVGRDLAEDLKAVAAYYKEMSGGAFALEAEVGKPAAVEAKRDEVAKWPSAGAQEKRLVLEVVGAFRNRIGEEAFAKVDGVALVAPGEIGARDTALWPHQSSVELADRRLNYLVLSEKAGKRWRGVADHEFGHLLGLEDKYEGIEGAVNVGPWCLMGTGYLGDKEKNPLPLCAVCRASLGWVKMATLDPRTDRAVVLAPGEAVRVKMNPDDREALVLEMREARLVAWHTGGGKAIEFVGVLPAAESDRLTALSRPALKGRTVGGYAVAVTDIRIEEGKAWLRIGASAAPTPLEELLRSRLGKTLGGK
jgi:M6 family metalloprotease-like protein